MTRSHVSERLARDGFVMPFTAFTEEETSALADAYNDSRTIAARDPLLAAVHTVFKPHLIWRWADTIVHHPRILDVVEAVLGHDILVWQMDVFRRDPHVTVSDEGRPPERSDEIASTGLDWHQDSLYLGLEPVEGVVRVWLALTETTIENGTMRYLRGSHRLGTRPHQYPDSHAGFAARGPRVELQIDDKEIVPVCLGPGDFAMHDIRIVHDSGPNRTDRTRVAVSITYVSAHIRATRRCSAMLARGCMPLTFDGETRPPADLDAESLTAFMRALQSRVEHMRAEGVPGFESP